MVNEAQAVNKLYIEMEKLRKEIGMHMTTQYPRSVVTSIDNAYHSIGLGVDGKLDTESAPMFPVTNVVFYAFMYDRIFR